MTFSLLSHFATFFDSSSCRAPTPLPPTVPGPSSPWLIRGGPETAHAILFPCPMLALTMDECGGEVREQGLILHM